jgi:putative drug exporter of the RND superfamily
VGLAGLGAVVVVLTAFTLLPAMLILPGTASRRRSPQAPSGRVFARIACGVLRRLLVTILAAAEAMAVLALPVLDLRLAQVDARLLRGAAQAHQVHDAVAVHFPSWTGPIPS